MEKIQNLIASVTGGEKIGFIDTTQTSLYVAAAAIAFNPIFWNIVARQGKQPFSPVASLDPPLNQPTEYSTHFLTHTFRSPYYGCYALGLTIFLLGLLRDYLYTSALDAQPLYPALHQPILGVALLAAGNTLVLSSMYALGVTGTYLGDYFGILMDSKVEGFPFNVTGAPMYWGSTLSFLGTALWYGRGAGLVLTVEVLLMYVVALRFEDPFTVEIYAKKDERPVTRSMTKNTPGKTRKKA